MANENITIGSNLYEHLRNFIIQTILAIHILFERKQKLKPEINVIIQSNYFGERKLEYDHSIIFPECSNWEPKGEAEDREKWNGSLSINIKKKYLSTNMLISSITNSMTYGTRRLNAVFTRALQ